MSLYINEASISCPDPFLLILSSLESVGFRLFACLRMFRFDARHCEFYSMGYRYFVSLSKCFLFVSSLFGDAFKSETF